MTLRDVVRDVAKSPEHLQRFGNDARDQAVGTLYRHSLGRQPDPAGQRAFSDLAAKRTPWRRGRPNRQLGRIPAVIERWSQNAEINILNSQNGTSAQI